jgi:hypothetical protein
MVDCLLLHVKHLGTTKIISVCSADCFKVLDRLTDRPVWSYLHFLKTTFWFKTLIFFFCCFQRVLFDHFTPMLTDFSVQFANGEDAKLRRRPFINAFSGSAIDEVFNQAIEAAMISWKVSRDQMFQYIEVELSAILLAEQSSA